MFFRNLEKYHIILGSKSPRRLQLLKETGINPEVLVLNGDDEDYPSHLSEIEIPVFLAKKKPTLISILFRIQTNWLLPLIQLFGLIIRLSVNLKTEFMLLKSFRHSLENGTR